MVPDEAYQKFARDGFIVPMACGNSIPKEFSNYPIVAGIKAEDWNGFHDLVMWDEIFRGAQSISAAFVGLVSSLNAWKVGSNSHETSRLSEHLLLKCMHRQLYKPGK